MLFKHCRRALSGLILFLLLAVPRSAAAQAPTWQWARPIGDWVNQLHLATAVDKWGNTYVTGTFDTLQVDTVRLLAPGYRDCFVGKLDPAGHWLWVRTLNTRYARGHKLVADSVSGDVLLAGEFDDSAHFGALTLRGTTLYRQQNFVARLSPDGQWRWVVSMVDEGTLSDLLPVMAFAPNNRVVLTTAFTGRGTFGPFTATSNVFNRSDLLVASLNATTGAWQWVQTGGGTDNDYALAIRTDARGNIYVRAMVSGPSPQFGSLVVPLPPRSSQYMTFRLTPAGQWQWFKAPGFDLGPSLGDRSFGTFNLWGAQPQVVGPATFTSRGLDDVILVEYDSTGTLRSAEQVGGPDNDYITALEAEPGGHLLVAGRFIGAITIGPFTLLDSVGLGDAFFLARVRPPLTPGGVWQWEWAEAITGASLLSWYPMGVGGGGLSVVAGLHAGALQFADLPLSALVPAECGVVAHLRWGPVPPGPVATPSLLAERVVWAVAPNPAAPTDRVGLLGVPPGPVELLDATGRLVRRVHVTALDSAPTMPVTGLPHGVYLVRAAGQVRRLVLGGH